MPARNTVKYFKSDSMYHVYNRGVDKRIIFQDERDVTVFLSYIKYALLPIDLAAAEVDKDLISEATRFNLRRSELYGKVELVAFCLMPNHFHLLLFQYDNDAITHLMRSVATGYSMYFNKRYGRKGTLFEGIYKAVEISSESYWLHISRYIHLNPIDLGMDWRKYSASSYHYYLGIATMPEWLHANRILDNFSSIKEYDQFVSDYISRHHELKKLSKELGF